MTEEPKKQPEEQEQLPMAQAKEGTVTPRMVHAVFWHMLKDLDGVTVHKDFFDNIPEKMDWKAQYDSVNKIWRFFVPREKKKKKIITPSRKVIHG